MQKIVQIANGIAEKISGIEGVEIAQVDDYNKFSSFQVVVYLDLDKKGKPKNKTFNMLKIRNAIKKILDAEKHVSSFGKSICTPKRMYDVYSYRNFRESTFIGYERNYIMVDFILV